MENNSRFETQIVPLEVKEKSKGNLVKFPFVDKTGKTVREIAKLETSCGCTTPLVYNDRIEVTYNNDTSLNGASFASIDPQWVTVRYKTEDPNNKGQYLPPIIKNEKGVDVANPALDFEYLKLEINVVS